MTQHRWTFKEAIALESLLAAGAAGARVTALDQVHGTNLAAAVVSVKHKLNDRYKNGLVMLEYKSAIGYVLIGRGDVLAQLFKEARERLTDQIVADRLIEANDKAASIIVDRLRCHGGAASERLPVSA